MLIYMCHAVDRSMPSILTEPIRAEFNLSDAQLGLFTGVAYGISLAIFVLQMGYFSDRVHRRNSLAVILFVWRICPALGGFARAFWPLVVTRPGFAAADPR